MDEPVRVVCNGGLSWPSAFTWRGRTHRIRRVEAFRWVEANGGDARGARIRLRTARGLRCWLSREPGRDIWRIERVLDSSGG